MALVRCSTVVHSNSRLAVAFPLTPGELVGAIPLVLGKINAANTLSFENIEQQHVKYIYHPQVPVICTEVANGKKRLSTPTGLEPVRANPKDF